MAIPWTVPVAEIAGCACLVPSKAPAETVRPVGEFRAANDDHGACGDP
jgi:hypothetical protein